MKITFSLSMTPKVTAWEAMHASRLTNTKRLLQQNQKSTWHVKGYSTVCSRLSVHHRTQEAFGYAPVLTWVCNYVSSCIQAGVDA